MSVCIHLYPKALEMLTNGIMRDTRAFHLDDPDWIELYNKQGSCLVSSDTTDLTVFHISHIRSKQLQCLDECRPGDGATGIQSAE